MNKKLVILLVIIILVASGIFVFKKYHKPVSSSSQTVQTQEITYSGQDGKTALELLKTKYPETETQKSSLGEFVNKINGNPTDSEKSKYWMFYVDGKQALVGADKYITKNTETITWKLQ